MPYEDDETRKAARKRLQARMARRGSAPEPEPRRQPGRQQGQRVPKETRPYRQPQRGTSRRTTTASTPKLPSIPPRVFAIIVAAVVLAIVAFAIVPNCSHPAGEQAARDEPTDTQGNGNQADSAIPEGDERIGKLIDIIGEDAGYKLIDAARSNDDALWIVSNIDQYAFDGPEVQAKVLKLAADEPEAIGYVREFPSQYPSSDAQDDGSIAMNSHSPSSNVPDTEVPHLYQWDRRWGYTEYSSAAFGLTGCGPTAMAMVYQGVTGKTDKNPHDFAIIAEQRNYMAQFDGTDSAFFTNIAEEYGLSCKEIYPIEEAIEDELESGGVIIANLGPGLFTEHGHFFVLAGLSDGGKVIVNDPYSVTRSSQTWDTSTIAGESITMYSYSTDASNMQ